MSQAAPDQPRRLDPVTPCMKGGDKKGQKRRARPDFVRDVTHNPPHFRPSTLNSWALQRGTADTPQKEEGLHSGEALEFPFLEDLQGGAQRDPCSSLWLVLLQLSGTLS